LLRDLAIHQRVQFLHLVVQNLFNAARSVQHVLFLAFKFLCLVLGKVLVNFFNVARRHFNRLI
jgi:hypothetical protein